MKLHSLVPLHVFSIFKNRFTAREQNGIGVFRSLSLNRRSSGFLRLKAVLAASEPKKKSQLDGVGSSLRASLCQLGKLISIFDNAQEKLPSARDNGIEISIRLTQFRCFRSRFGTPSSTFGNEFEKVHPTRLAVLFSNPDKNRTRREVFG
jgi:hypothetical protein